MGSNLISIVLNTLLRVSRKVKIKTGILVTMNIKRVCTHNTMKWQRQGRSNFRQRLTAKGDPILSAGFISKSNVASDTLLTLPLTATRWGAILSAG